MSIDLYSVLVGGRTEPLYENAERVSEARKALSLKCPCGREVGSVHACSDGLQVLVQSRKLTRAHTSDIVVQTYLEDLEELINEEMADTAEQERLLRIVMAFGEAIEDHQKLRSVVPPLVIPPRVHEVCGLLEAMAKDAAVTERDGLKPHRFNGLQSNCAKCGSSYYLGEALKDWDESGQQATTVVLSKPDHESKVSGFGWPREKLQDRARLYAILSTALVG